MFPTEQQIYHRLRWDPRFDVRRCHVVITLKPSGTQRMPFLELDVGAVPWHRIIEFWVDDELAWSRPQRIDRLDELAARDEPCEPPPPPPPPVGPAIAPVRWSGGWHADDAPPSDGTRLRVAMWNLLFDRHLADELDSERRWRVALDELGALAADVIVLAEVTQDMLALVLQQPWVRERYASSHGPGAKIARYTQIVLSRHRIAGGEELPLMRDKRAVLARVATPLGELGVAAIHLSSNYATDAPQIRTAQMRAILARLAQLPATWLVAGDFNADPDELAELLGAADDCWATARPGERGYTFDVDLNPLAARMSRRGRSARYDRILVLPPLAAGHAEEGIGRAELAHAARGLRVIGCELVGAGHGEAPPSDHFGVVADLEGSGAVAPVSVATGDLATAPGSRRTALVVMPPRDAWGPVQRVRCARDGKFARWPPHVTLLFPFVDRAWIDGAASTLAGIARDVAPFELELERPGAINAKTTVLWPSAATVRDIAALQARLAAPFAALHDGHEFHAHLTIARGPAQGDVPFDELRLGWTVDRVAIVAESDGRFEVVREIPLGGTPLVEEPPAPRPAERVVADVRRIVRDLAGDAADDIAIEPYGSAIYAPEHAGDVDLVIRTGAVPAQELAELLAVSHGLAMHGPPWRLRGTLAGTRVDAVVLAGDEQDAARWLAGPRDGALLREHVVLHGREAAFRAAWPQVRAFARARALDRNGLGYFGGFGWAMLLAVALVHDARACAAPPDRAFAAWLRWLGGLRPGTRIGFDAVRPDPQPLYIAAPAPPSRDAARFVTAGTAATLFAEFRRAAKLADDPSVATDLARDPPPGETIAIRGSGDLARGRYEGIARRVIGDLEAAMPIRVWGRFEGTADAWEHRITVPAARADEARAIVAAIAGDVSV